MPMKKTAEGGHSALDANPLSVLYLGVFRPFRNLPKSPETIRPQANVTKSPETCQVRLSYLGDTKI